MKNPNLLIASLLVVVLAMGVFLAPAINAGQGKSGQGNACVRRCQVDALAAAEACNGNFVCLQAVRLAYQQCVASCAR